MIKEFEKEEDKFEDLHDQGDQLKEENGNNGEKQKQ